MQIHIIDKDFVLNQITEEEIFMRYFPLSDINETKKYLNPLRQDFHADCSFYRNNSSGILYFNDFAWRSFDCISFVQAMYNLTYHQALEHIAVTFNLTGSTYAPSVKTVVAVKPKVILDLKVAEKEFTWAELRYWKDYDPTTTSEILKEYHIHSLRAAWIEGKQIYAFKGSDIAFYYHLTNGYNYQLYNPYKFFETTKFIQTKNNYRIGYHSLNPTANYVLIIKSYKCFYVSRRLGLNSLGQLTEMMMFEEDLMLELRVNYDYIFTLFDNDKTGKKASIRYRNKYNTIPLLFPEDMSKDLSDNVKENRDEVLDIIQELTDTYGLTHGQEDLSSS